MRDPKNFPHPEQFIPDRYDEVNPQYNPSAYMAFGLGPRACIGNIQYTPFNILTTSSGTLYTTHVRCTSAIN